MDEKNLAGIPIRRPNGMNRHGLILEEVGFEAMLRKFTDRIARPLAQMLFPDLVFFSLFPKRSYCWFRPGNC